MGLQNSKLEDQAPVIEIRWHSMIISGAITAGEAFGSKDYVYYMITTLNILCSLHICIYYGTILHDHSYRVTTTKVEPQTYFGCKHFEENQMPRVDCIKPSNKSLHM